LALEVPGVLPGQIMEAPEVLPHLVRLLLQMVEVAAQQERLHQEQPEYRVRQGATAQLALC
jgi:hypothetical protein